MPTSNLASRLRDHAQVHEDLIRDASDEQAQWALDLREAAALLETSVPCCLADRGPEYQDGKKWCEVCQCYGCDVL